MFIWVCVLRPYFLCGEESLRKTCYAGKFNYLFYGIIIVLFVFVRNNQRVCSRETEKIVSTRIWQANMLFRMYILHIPLRLVSCFSDRIPGRHNFVCCRLYDVYIFMPYTREKLKLTKTNLKKKNQTFNLINLISLK